jgi:hypothetical protein
MANLRLNLESKLSDCLSIHLSVCLDIKWPRKSKFSTNLPNVATWIGKFGLATPGIEADFQSIETVQTNDEGF